METLEMKMEREKKSKPNVVLNFLNAVRKKIAEVFEPEEVEVDCEEDHGKIVRYTYTKVHKEVA